MSCVRSGGSERTRPTLPIYGPARPICRPASLLLLIIALFWSPRPARADWLFSGYMGVASTSSNTLTVTPATGRPFSVPSVDYEGEAFRSPWYYGVRAGWLSAATRGVGYEIERTPAKAIAQVDPPASDLNAFQPSHGINFPLGNLAYRFA